jgi:hypothetical protein
LLVGLVGDELDRDAEFFRDPAEDLFRSHDVEQIDVLVDGNSDDHPRLAL